MLIAYILIDLIRVCNQWEFLKGDYRVVSKILIKGGLIVD